MHSRRRRPSTEGAPSRSAHQFASATAAARRPSSPVQPAARAARRLAASHGDTQLGGDDFDALLAGHLTRAFERAPGLDLRDPPALVRARLLGAAEEAKKRLVRDGVPLRLELEVSREEYEGLIRPLVERTLESVTRALADAGRRSSGLDAILLVGGSTRTPLVARLLEERTGIVPRQEVHPDLCVALGAGVLASRLGGHAVERVLVDVSPHSFGPSFLGDCVLVASQLLLDRIEVTLEVPDGVADQTDVRALDPVHVKHGSARGLWLGAKGARQGLHRLQGRPNVLCRLGLGLNTEPAQHDPRGDAQEGHLVSLRRPRPRAPGRPRA